MRQTFHLKHNRSFTLPRSIQCQENKRKTKGFGQSLTLYPDVIVAIQDAGAQVGRTPKDNMNLNKQ